MWDIKAVLWDLDNTITDSREEHFVSWDMVFKKHNIPHDRNFFETHYGTSNREMLAPYSHLGDVMRMSDEKEEIYRNLILKDSVKLLPGVMDFLEYFRAHNLAQAVASSAPMSNIVIQINLINLADYFYVLVSGAVLSQGKPHPQVFLNAAAGVGVDPVHCLVIEDTLHGIEGALRGGMHCILVRKVSDKDKSEIEHIVKQYAHRENQYIIVDSLEQIRPHDIIQYV